MGYFSVEHVAVVGVDDCGELGAIDQHRAALVALPSTKPPWPALPHSLPLAGPEMGRFPGRR